MQGTSFGLGGGREVALRITANWGGWSRWFIWEKGCLQKILEVLWLIETPHFSKYTTVGLFTAFLKEKKNWNRLTYIICFSFIGNRYMKSLPICFVCYPKGWVRQENTWPALKLTVHLVSENIIYPLCIPRVCVTFYPFSNSNTK